MLFLYEAKETRKIRAVTQNYPPRELKRTGSKSGRRGSKNITLKVLEHLPPSVTSLNPYSKSPTKSNYRGGCFNHGFILECNFVPCFLIYGFHRIPKTNVKEENPFWLTELSFPFLRAHIQVFI